MEIYIGLDVHARSTTCAWVGPTGKRLGSTVVETARDPLVAAVRAIDGTKHVCFEEGTASAWVYEVLSPHVAEAVCCQPRRRPGSKSDAHDA